MLSNTLNQAAQDAAALEGELAAAKTGLEPLRQENAGLRTELEQQTVKVTALTEEVRVLTAQRDRAWARGEQHKLDFAKLEAEIKRLQGLEATFKTERDSLRKEVDALAARLK